MITSLRTALPLGSTNVIFVGGFRTVRAEATSGAGLDALPNNTSSPSLGFAANAHPLSASEGGEPLPQLSAYNQAKATPNTITKPKAVKIREGPVIISTAPIMASTCLTTAAARHPTRHTPIVIPKRLTKAPLWWPLTALALNSNPTSTAYKGATRQSSIIVAAESHHGGVASRFAVSAVAGTVAGCGEGAAPVAVP